MNNYPRIVGHVCDYFYVTKHTCRNGYPVYSEYLSSVTVTAETFLSYPALGLNFLIFYESCDCKIC